MEQIPALDGLRGVAVLLVVAFHAWPELVPAGSYGVTVFFVLSGFLIARLLAGERDRLGSADKVGVVTCPQCGHSDRRRFYPRWVRVLMGWYSPGCGASDGGQNPSGWPGVCGCDHPTHH